MKERNQDNGLIGTGPGALDAGQGVESGVVPVPPAVVGEAEPLSGDKGEEDAGRVRHGRRQKYADAPCEKAEEYVPEHPELAEVWLRLLPETRRSRFEEARRRLAGLRAISGRERKESERAAIARVVTWAHRSSVRRWQEGYRDRGFDGLVDWRVSPPSIMPHDVVMAVCTLRRMNPQIDVEAIVEHIRKFHDYESSPTTVRRVLRRSGLSRRCGPASSDSSSGTRRLELGGLKLLEAAAVETGYLSSLTHGIIHHVEGMLRPDDDCPVDREGRDDYGRFTPAYNERYRRGPDDAIGPGFLSVTEKRAGLDPDHLQISMVRAEVIEQKLMALWVSPLLGGGRWDGIRVPRGQLLEEVCGIGYMPATLDRFTRELKYAGVAETLWEIHGRKWLELGPSLGKPGDSRMSSVIFVDGTTKPQWTKLYCESAPVSKVNRVMPALDVIAFHTGYGVPILEVTFSGRAPLVREVPALLSRMDEMWGEAAQFKIVVIDAEGNSIPFLRGLEAEGRGWITRIRPSLVAGKDIFNRNNYRPYRKSDRVRSGIVDMQDSNGEPFRMRLVEIERRGKSELTYLGASLSLREQEWRPQQLANLYFQRWPCEEANFRAVNQAVGSKEVHGYGKKLISNVSVVSSLDDLQAKQLLAETRLHAQEAKEKQLRLSLRENERLLAKSKVQLAKVDATLEEHLAPGKSTTTRTSAILIEQRTLSGKVLSTTEATQKLRTQLHKVETIKENTNERLGKYRSQVKILADRMTIFAHDVELDSLFSLLKVGMVLMVTYVLHHYLSQAKMEPVTFLERFATLPATLRVTPQLEILTFEYNQRDPEMMGLLASCVESINDRALVLRNGKRLRVAVAEPPTSARPRPAGSRSGSGDRFR